MTLTHAEAEVLLTREAMLLDRGDWDEWLALYAEDAIFWMPAWRDELNPTEDPDSELSLIYYKGRRNLEDRVWRARSGLSVASAPRPRVVHQVTNVLVEDGHRVAASFSTHLFDKRAERTHTFFGRYDYALVRTAEDGAWKIAMKKITLLNDTIPTVVDFYSV
ncbi:MAG TPA: aromatic-ring-hydroxylating dioxygenase subunit beta [Allosphingosinicella sp.]|nr:aromatic-ring-hydroxylating dioxygenase subunit beta [Allosphingosinicella sp.]